MKAEEVRERGRNEGLMLLLGMSALPAGLRKRREPLRLSQRQGG